MGRDPRNACRSRVPLKQLPDDLFAQRCPLDLIAPVHQPEHGPGDNRSGRCPGIDCYLRPVRDGYCAHSAMLAEQIRDAPSTIPLLDVFHDERRHFRPAEATAEEYGQDRAIAEALRSGRVRGVQQLLGLLDG